MNRENTLDSIPIDLFFEIFSRLPTKSVGRCRCVSKQWASLLGRKDFTELFMTRSSTRPRLLFALEGFKGEWLFYSSPHPQNTSEKSILVAVDFHTKFHKTRSNCIYASGLFYFPDGRISEKKGEDPVPVICNPLTGRYAILPKLRTGLESRSFFGFDPIDKQFKVLVINDKVKNETVHYILTLGAGEMWWRKILNCPSTHKPFGEGICINGVLYYRASTTQSNEFDVIVCFDVRSEKFKFIDKTCFYHHKLINYKGKLGGIRFKYDDDDHREWNREFGTCEMRMWVLEDVEKQEWSEYVYPIRENETRQHLSVVGTTATGEIILSENLKYDHVLYFSPEKNTLQCVKYHFGGGVNLKELAVHAFVDHVEDLSVTDAKQLQSSIYDLSTSKSSFESINIFDALCRLDDD